MPFKKHDFRPCDIPAKPGCYVYRDLFGTVIYVGKASNLRRRMSQYFQPSQQARADAKLRSLIHSIDTWDFLPVRNEEESLILESRLIKEYAPRYNILMRDDKRLLMLKLDRTEPFPRLKLVRLKKDDSCDYYGPFPNGAALKQTAEFLVRHLGLRTCKCTDPDRDAYAHCMAGAIRDCCRPCIGAVSRDEYNGRINRLDAILRGDVREIMAVLQQRMREASEKHQFEKAALLRDVRSNLESLYTVKFRSFTRTSLNPHAVSSEAVADLQKALGLKRTPANIECFDISNISGTLAVAGMVHFTDGAPDKAKYRRFRIRTVEGSNDFAMMAEAVTRHFTRLLASDPPHLPDLLMVDGGKGQLSVTLDALTALGCPAFPVIGLAKKQEEIFIPGRSDAIRLSPDRKAILLLQAVRDEAHRFAITYHRALRLETIRNSILDEIEGVGAIRKASLLREFGSVRRLRKVSPEEIATRVPGIGLDFARTIYDYLQSHAPDGGIDPL